MKRLTSDKLGMKLEKSYFVEYPKETNGYYFYHPTEHKMFVARHAMFLVKEFVSKRTSGNKVELEEIPP